MDMCEGFLHFTETIEAQTKPGFLRVVFITRRKVTTATPLADGPLPPQLESLRVIAAEAELLGSWFAANIALHRD